MSQGIYDVPINHSGSDCKKY